MFPIAGMGPRGTFLDWVPLGSMVVPPFKQLPRVVRFVLGNVITGAAIGWVVAIFAVMADFRGLGTLVWDSPHLLVAAALIALSSGAAFGLGYLATALLMLDSD
jgi:hypothetical protein